MNLWSDRRCDHRFNAGGLKAADNHRLGTSVVIVPCSTTEYYVMENGKMVKLGVTKEEKDLGIYTTNDLKPMHESGFKSKVDPGHDSVTFQDYRR